MEKQSKSAEAFRTISEVSDILEVPQHVLRFWEGKFSQIKPMKRGGNRRYYRPEDLELLRTISHLLYTDGYTIKGVQKLLRENGVRATVNQFVAEYGSSGQPVADKSAPALPDDAALDDTAGDIPYEAASLAAPMAAAGLAAQKEEDDVLDLAHSAEADDASSQQPQPSVQAAQANVDLDTVIAELRDIRAGLRSL